MITVGYRDGSPPPAQEWVRRRAATSLTPSGWLSARRARRLLISISFVVLFCCQAQYMLSRMPRQTRGVICWRCVFVLREMRAFVAESYPTDRASLERDCDIQYFVATGPGGQHRNKVETGVRLTHCPTGLVVTATERRSQYANREAAYERMAAKLEEMQKPVEPRIPTKPSAASRERRLEEKKRASARKRDRRATPPDE